MIDKDKLIGKGMNSEVFSLDDDKVIKLYYENILEKEILDEYEIGKKVNQAGIPSPNVIELVDDNGRKGIIFERIYGDSMLTMIAKKPWKISTYARHMARLHARIHSYTIKHLPKQNDYFSSLINRVPNELVSNKEQLLEYLYSLPEGNIVCHGDFHPDNILKTDNDWVVIDWTNIYMGNPLSDVARTMILIKTPYMNKGTPLILVLLAKFLKWLLYKIYIKEYIKITKIKKQDIKDWLVIVAVKRLLEKIPGEEKWLLKIINRKTT